MLKQHMCILLQMLFVLDSEPKQYCMSLKQHINLNNLRTNLIIKHGFNLSTGIATPEGVSKWKCVCTLSGHHQRAVYSIDW